jgi:general secretion pathway protein D
MSYRRRQSLPLGILLAITAVKPLSAQDQQTFLANFREQDIQQVVAVVHEYTGRTILLDRNIAGSQITFYHQSPMTAEELWQAFLQMLQSSGFGAVESEGIWRIVPEATMRTQASPLVAGTGAEIVTRTIEANNVPSAQMVPILRPMLGTNAQLGAVQGTNMLIVVDRADNVQRMVDIVRQVDAASAQDIEVVPLSYAAAEDVTQKVTGIAQAQSGGGGLVGLQAIPDERTNSVILTGTPSQLAYFREVVASLDLPSNQGGGAIVRFLNYADAEEIASNLSSQFGGTPLVEDAETAADLTGGAVTVWANPGTNSIVMSAPSRIQQEMMRIVDSLDIPRAQVHVQAIIVEMSDSRAAELGLTWIVDGSGGDRVAALTNFSSTTAGILSLAAIGAGGTPDPNLLGDGVTAAVGSLSDSGTSWAAVISALRGDAQTNVLQTPELVVLDNAEASINVGQEVPFLTGSYASTGVNQGGSVNPFSTIQRENVGTTLTITPRINEGTGMRLSIEQITSSLSSSAVASDVITNERSIITEVFVEDGDILVLGGLMDDQLRENEQRVPGLGRIPGLKWLFRARGTERAKSNLMVFIRPTILRDSIDASRLSGDKYRLLQDEQRKRAEEPVPLLRDSDRPALPELNGPSSDDSLPPQAPPPSPDELRQGQLQ